MGLACGNKPNSTEFVFIFFLSVIMELGIVQELIKEADLKEEQERERINVVKPIELVSDLAHLSAFDTNLIDRQSYG